MAQGTELGKAYVQIIPSAEGISGKLSGLLGGGVSSAGKSAGASFGSSLVSALGGVLAAAGIGAMLKKSLDAGGALQQSLGGLDTIYGDAAKAAKNYSAEAVKAGISANDYAEQAVSFGASLKQAYGGDTVKAVEAANTAILDMADNSAKMGTDITSVQNAYQGFAKQNYTMLDNLKLGYGGTKTEMQRLLKDAEKLSGVKYDLNNLGDVYDAIHVIQQDLGLTGVAAAEASETFSGSFAAMTAAGENLLANLSLGNDITPYLSTLLETTGTFLTGNLFPMIGNIFQSLPQVISEGLIPALNEVIGLAISGLNFAADNADAMVSTGLDLVTTLGLAIIQAAPALIDAAVNCAIAFGNALINYDWASLGTQLLTSLQTLIPTESATSIMQPILDGITASLPGLLSTGVEIISNLANGILEAVPQLLTTAGELIIQFADFLMQNAPTLLSAAADLVMNLVNGIINNLPQIVTAATKIVLELAATILKNAPSLIASGVQITIKLLNGITQAAPQLVTAFLTMWKNAADSAKKYDWMALGKNIVDGIIKGISSMGSALITSILSMCSGAFSAVKKFFGISSPSKLMADEVGRYIPEGIAVGIEENSQVVNDAVKDMVMDATTADALTSYAFSAPETETKSSDANVLARMDAMLDLMSKYFPEMADSNGNISISAINRQLGVAYS